MSFSEITHNIVSEFIQTVVILDDGSYFVNPRSEDYSINTNLDSPSDREQIIDNDDESELTQSSSSQHLLNAKVLTDSFAKRGQVCAILVPDENDDLVQNTISAARNADVLILDWQINNDDGDTAHKIIQQLINEDEERGGRLRLFIIYTGEPDLDVLYESLKKQINSLIDVNKDEHILGLNNYRIKFVLKYDGNPTDGISEDELPNLVIDIFADFAGGLVPNAVMSAIHQVRENTHHVLQRFNKELDGSFIAHRLLLKNQEDASRYLIELIADELKATFDYSSIGNKSIGDKALSQYINDEQYPCTNLCIKEKVPIDDTTMVELTKEEVIHSLIHNEFDPNMWRSSKSLFQRIHPLFHLNADEGKDRFLQLSRISSLRYELNSQLNAVAPQLKLGTVLKTKSTKEYYVCLQPLCDCVRLGTEPENPFIFGKFKESGSSFDLVINDSKKNVCLSFLKDPFQTKIFSFGSENGTCILPQREKENWIFSPKGNFKLIWIAELRPAFAQRLVHRIMSQLSRIGVDEFEWQRQHSNYK